MKKTFLFFLLTIVMSMLLFQCAQRQPQEAQPAADRTAQPAQPAAPPKPEPVKLTFSIFFPPTHEQAKTADAFAKEIEKLTDGQAVISVFPGEALTKAPQVYEGVVQGLSDMGLSCFAYTRGKFPVLAALDLPLGYPNGKIATKVANEFIKTFAPEELKDVKVLYVHAHGPGLLHTKKPVKKLSDLKKMKIRATGLSANIIKALGGNPVGMPQGETYEALQKGLVDGTIGPMEVLKGWKQAEVIKYTTDCKEIGYTTAMFVVMNLNKWNALPQNVKDVIDQTSQKWTELHGEAWDKIDEEGRAYTTEKKNEIITLSPDEIKKWQKAVEPVVADFIKTTPDGQKYVDKIRELIAAYSK